MPQLASAQSLRSPKGKSSGSSSSSSSSSSQEVKEEVELLGQWGDQMVASSSSAPRSGLRGVAGGASSSAASSSYTLLPPDMSDKLMSGMTDILASTYPNASDDTTAPCVLMEIVKNLGLICPVTTIFGQLMVQRPPDWNDLVDQKQPVLRLKNGTALNAYDLPGDLKDLRPLPDFVDKCLADSEKPMYYWLYRLVLNMYDFVYEWADTMLEGKDPLKTLRALVPTSWSEPRLLFTPQLKQNWHRPLSLMLRRGDEMLLVSRGTMFQLAWSVDFTYVFAPKNISEAWGFPGRVHWGVLNVTEKLFPLLEEDLQRVKPKKLTIAGHSFGGAMTLMLGAYVRIHHPEIQLQVVSFASPQVGDREFVEWYRNNINLRRVIYMGSGVQQRHENRGMWFGVGDMVPQTAPWCIEYEVCEGLDFLKEANVEHAKSVQYARMPGIARFYSKDMRNSEAWYAHENYILDIRVLNGMMESHLCSYMCWASDLIDDPEDLCYFRDDPNIAQHPYPCNVDLLHSNADKYPATLPANLRRPGYNHSMPIQGKD